MALRDQPYIPLYVKDIMTDECLNDCSAATHGIYIKGIMCLMHKQEDYGKILLKQKYKQTSSTARNFALSLAKQLPYTEEEIYAAITELIDNKVCYFEGDFLCQKRMIRDNEISVGKAENGRNGGKATQSKNRRKNTSQAKNKQNTVTVSVIENATTIEFSKALDELLAYTGPDKFEKYWQLWKQFKKQQFKFSYKSIGETAAKKALMKKSNNDQELACKMILQSIDKGWQDTYPLKENSIQDGRKNNNSAQRGSGSNRVGAFGKF